MNIRRKNNKLVIIDKHKIILEHLCSSEDIVNKMEVQAAVLEKIFANHTEDKDFNSKIFK